jgi:RNA polymerase sigma factor (sigma-70 family)
MPDRSLTTVINQISAAAAAGGVADAQLLERFVQGGDEAAFELLVWRHARLVHSVCRRILGDVHDAEDAFQATFLVLARKARGIGKRGALAGWLYTVARRVSLSARADRSRKASQERPLGGDVPAPAAPDSVTERDDVRAVLDEEVSRLPEKFRTPAVLCYLEGKTVAEAARQLGCPRGTVASRLARARHRLRTRLVRRGLAVSAGLPAALARPATAAPALIRATARAAAPFANGKALSPGTMTARAAALTEEVLKAMLYRKIKVGVVLLLAVAGVLVAGGGLALRLRADFPEVRAAAQADEPAAPAPAGPEQPKAKAAPAEAAKAVTVSHPLRREAIPYEYFTGRLEPGPAIQVRADQSGRVHKQHFKEGDEVKKGEVLFEMTHGPGEGLKVQAPADGILVRIFYNAGSLAAGGEKGSALAALQPFNPIGARFDMDERSYLRWQRLLRAGKVKKTDCTLAMGLADEEGYPHHGALTSFEGKFNPGTGMIGAHGTFPNPDKLFLPGMFARVRMAFGKARPVLEVPDAAILRDQGKGYVLVVNERQVVERQRVKHAELDPASGLRVVEEGLRPDDWVIVQGVTDVRPGARVEPRRERLPRSDP